MTAVFTFQQRTDDRSPGIDISRAAAKVSAAADVVVVIMLLLVVQVQVLVVVVLLVMIIRMMVGEFQARIAPVQRVLYRSLLSARRRRQTGVGASSQHVAVVIVHRLGRMLARCTSGGVVAGTGGGGGGRGAPVPRASF